MVFHPLNKDNIRAIAEIQLKRLINRMEAWLCVALYGCDPRFHQRNRYDPIYGARPLKRAIQQEEIENPLAQQILSGSLLPKTDQRGLR